jgi:acetoacetyl-CoA reductase/3-oxoacyl-[acyl-carrier protein] reductase
MYEINLKAPFQLTQSLLPGMIANGWGRIVNVTSIGGQWGGTKQIHYAVMKSGLIGLTKSIAKTFSSNGITCNAVAPGLIATNMIATELPTKKREEVAKTIPVGRIGEASDVANVVKFLVSDSASYLTGQTVNVNGGMYFS